MANRGSLLFVPSSWEARFTFRPRYLGFVCRAVCGRGVPTYLGTSTRSPLTGFRLINGLIVMWPSKPQLLNGRDFSWRLLSLRFYNFQYHIALAVRNALPVSTNNCNWI